MSLFGLLLFSASLVSFIASMILAWRAGRRDRWPAAVIWGTCALLSLEYLLPYFGVYLFHDVKAAIVFGAAGAAVIVLALRLRRREKSAT